MVHCGIWHSCIVGFVGQVYCPNDTHVTLRNIGTYIPCACCKLWSGQNKQNTAYVIAYFIGICWTWLEDLRARSKYQGPGIEEYTSQNTVECNYLFRKYFVDAPSQWETLQCNVVSHWLGAYTKWSLLIRYLFLTLKFSYMLFNVIIVMECFSITLYVLVMIFH